MSILFIKKNAPVVMIDSALLHKQIEKQKEAIHAYRSVQDHRPILSLVTAAEVDLNEGKKALQKNKVGALMLAGGAGSRLGFHQPKGCFPLFEGKTLYEFALSTLKQGHQLAVMTSPLTDEKTRSFFKEYQYFGLAPSQVDFFCQESWPLLDAEEKPFWEEEGKIAMGPNGNGSALSLFAASPIFQKWQQLGIEHISLFPVDNPLADPLYLPLLSYHILSNAEITIAVAKKRSPDEKMGVLGRSGDKMKVIEYSELPLSMRDEFLYGNMGLMLFSMEFAERMKGKELPIHVVKKMTKQWVGQNERGLLREVCAYKFEQFIFDLLDYSDRSAALLCDREQLFAPLKEQEGVDGVVSVQQAVQRNKKW